MTDITQICFDIVRAYIKNTEYQRRLTEAELSAAFALLQKHDLAHIAGIVLQEAYDDPMLVQVQFTAALRYEKSNYELDRICAVFEKHGIFYIPLKGAVIRDWYPEAWHRTSADIDILVPEDCLDNAAAALKSELDYTANPLVGVHDMHMRSPNGLNVELHYDLCHDGIHASDAFDTAVKWDGFRRSMSPEMFMLYHMAHMAKHFKAGGCGIRPLLDLVFIKRNLDYDKEKLDGLLEENGLKKFSDAMLELSEIWFGDKEINAFYDVLSGYIVEAGAYGTLRNDVLVGHALKKGRIKYIAGRIFMKREYLKYLYPSIEKYPLLLPFYEVARWTNLLKPDRIYRAGRELKINNMVSKEEQSRVSELVTSLGLS